MKKKSMLGMIVGMVVGLIVVPFFALSVISSEDNSKMESMETWGDNLIDNYLEGLGFYID